MRRLQALLGEERRHQVGAAGRPKPSKARRSVLIGVPKRNPVQSGLFENAIAHPTIKIQPLGRRKVLLVKKKILKKLKLNPYLQIVDKKSTNTFRFLS